MPSHGGPLVLDALINNDHTEGQPAKNPDLAEHFRMFSRVMAIPATSGNAVAILRLEAWIRQFQRRRPARSVAVLNKPVVIPPLDVRFGPGRMPSWPRTARYR